MAIKNMPYLFVLFSLIVIFLIIILPFSRSQQPVRGVWTASTSMQPPPSSPSSTLLLSRLYSPPSPQVHQLLNPFTPPVVAGPIFGASSNNQAGSYQQVGILTLNTPPLSAADTLILPLMGRQSNIRRDRWQYYTLANGIGNFPNKLPISVQNKKCSSDGCEEIYTGDSVWVKGYNQGFTATIYENQTLQYMADVI